MEERRIITLSGRMGSGKSELGKVCEKLGFVKMSFAKPLKLLVCDLLEFDSIESLDSAKYKPQNKIVTDKIIEKICQRTNIAKATIELYIDGLITKDSTVRDWLQVIGTDVIRQCDENWHVNETLKLMDKTTNYVFDDVRFINELEALYNLGAESWFIMRDYFENISQHPSETSLTAFSFGLNTIINNGDLDDLLKRWENFILRGYEENVVRADYINMYFSGHDVPEEKLRSLLISPDHKSLVDKNALNIKTDIKKLKNGYKVSIVTDNMFILEKLKELM